jgi:hypothetical protein
MSMPVITTLFTIISHPGQLTKSQPSIDAYAAAGATFQESSCNGSFTDEINGVANALKALYVIVADGNLERALPVRNDV